MGEPGGGHGASREEEPGRATGRAAVGWSGSGSGRLGQVAQTNGGGRVMVAGVAGRGGRGGRAMVAGVAGGGRAMVDELPAEASSRSVYIKRPVKPCQVGLHAWCPSGAQRSSESRTVAVAESAVSAVTLRVTPNSPTQPHPSWTCLASVRRSASI